MVQVGVVEGIAFNEEQCGYFAGYAVVKEGYACAKRCANGSEEHGA